MKKSKLDRVISVVVIGICLLKAVLYGGSKPPSSTNEPPEIVDGDAPTNAAPPVLMASRPRLVMSPSASYPSQSSYSSQSISNWTARGAYCDWQRIDFPDAFRFPVGTNLIDAVTLLAWGEVRVKSKSRVEVEQRNFSSDSFGQPEQESNYHSSTSTSNFDYSLPARVSLEPNASSVTHGLTPSNSYLFAWTNCCVERSATNRVNASIELFRSGACSVRFGNVETFHPAPVPPDYPGNGQDEAWIRATFPDEADNILSMGYAAWLAQWVGVDEQNGRFKASVTIAALPADGTPCYLTCGRYHVNVVAPGTYSFPLEVFETYEVTTSPSPVPFAIDFDDGYTGGEQSYEIVNANPRPRLLAASPDNASSSLTFYRFYMKPLVIVTPNHIPRSEADGARVSLWCNLANVTRRFVRTAAREFYLNFCWPSDAEIEATEDDLENEVAAEEDAMEIVYESPKGECSGWLYIDGNLDDNDSEEPVRENAFIYSGPAWQTSYTNDCLVCQLTVTTTDGSTATHEESGAAILAEGQGADVSVYFETTEYGGDIYDDEVEWQVLVNGTAAMSGSASVSSATPGEALETQRVNPPSDGVLRIRLVGRARNVADGLRQSCVRIVVTAIDEGAAPAQP